MEEGIKAKISRIEIKVSKLDLNSGQIEGLPANPRQWTSEDVDRLAKSIDETPELLAMRCPIVVPNGDRFVVIGGNLRIAAAKKLKLSSIPCFSIEGADRDKIREIVIKDNGAFGEWDIDALANEWDDLPLAEWGVDVDWNGDPKDEGGNDEQESEGDPYFVGMSFANMDDWIKAQALLGFDSSEFKASKGNLSEDLKKCGRMLDGGDVLARLLSFGEQSGEK